MDPIMLGSNHGPGNSGAAATCFLTLLQFHQPKHVQQAFKNGKSPARSTYYSGPTVADPCSSPHHFISASPLLPTGLDPRIHATLLFHESYTRKW